jgi:hypothetical protein
VGFAASANAQTARGGSSHLWYKVDGPQQFACYGILKNYHVPSVATEVNTQLATMYANGQQRLRVGIGWVHDPQEANPGGECYGRPNGEQGTYMNSNPNAFDWQYLTNLRNYLAQARTVGFVEYLIVMGGAGPNDQRNWTSWQPGYLEENWNVISQVHTILEQEIRNQGRLYRADFCGECLHNAAVFGYAWSYAQEIWLRWCSNWTKEFTVGFSFAGVDAATQVNGAMDIYDYSGYGRPNVYSIHLYYDAYNMFWNFQNAFTNRGDYYTGWIIGETFYNDPVNASQIYNAKVATGRNVFYLVQWPLNRNSSADDVDQAPVNDFYNYIGYGW